MTTFPHRGVVRIPTCLLLVRPNPHIKQLPTCLLDKHFIVRIDYSDTYSGSFKLKLVSLFSPVVGEGLDCTKVPFGKDQRPAGVGPLIIWKGTK